MTMHGILSPLREFAECYLRLFEMFMSNGFTSVSLLILLKQAFNIGTKSIGNIDSW